MTELSARPTEIDDRSIVPKDSVWRRERDSVVAEAQDGIAGAGDPVADACASATAVVDDIAVQCRIVTQDIGFLSGSAV